MKKIYFGLAAVILYLVIWGAFVLALNARADALNAEVNQCVGHYKFLPQWLLVQVGGVFGLTVILLEYGRKWRKINSDGTRGDIGEFLTKLYCKHTDLLLTHVEPENGDVLLNELESLKKGDSAVPFNNESDIERGYALAYTALASGNLSSEQLQKLDQLGEELNASQERWLLFPSISGKKLEIYISLILVTIGVALPLASIQMLTPLGFKFFFFEGILLYGICFWVIFRTPIYMLNDMLQSWFFKLFFWILELVGISCASSLSTLINREGAWVTVWKDRLGRVVATEVDYTATFFLFAFKFSFAITLLFVITLVLMPFASLALVARNFILYK